MVARLAVPALKNPNIAIHVTQSAEEIEAANALVCRNYVDEGYWDDAEPFRNNEHMRSLARTVFVAVDDGRVVATASIVRDSPAGLPADKFQPESMARLRARGERLAEVSALALDKHYGEQRTLVLFLLKYVYQYSFYYTDVERFVVVPTVRHVGFYQAICGFTKLSSSGQYNYVKETVRAQLLTANLFEAHLDFFERFARGKPDSENFYRFMLVDEHPSLHFPQKHWQRRPREHDWVAEARSMALPLAV